MNGIYKALRILNDIKAVFKGKIVNRLWNRVIGKIAWRFMKR